jgi:trehalose-phosphatase
MNSADSARLNAFWRRLKEASQRALLLDYDGTLAPFREERDQAVPYPGVREELEAILADGTTRLVVISGRSIEDLLPLLGLKSHPEIWGCHGWERLLPDGSHEIGDLPEGAAEALEEAAALLRQAGHAERCERKPVSVAFHWRGLDPERIARLDTEVTEAWNPLAERGGLELHPFDGGLELRVPGRDKGFAVRRILADLDEGAAVAYLGDDLTDEDAFRAMEGRGLSILVRREPRPTAAELRLEPPDELLQFLCQWLTVGASEGRGL